MFVKQTPWFLSELIDHYGGFFPPDTRSKHQFLREKNINHDYVAVEYCKLL